MNNQTFELKDSYLGDFESKLDVYNKKGKGLFWFIFGGLVLFTCIYDFSILPQYNLKQQYKIVKIKASTINSKSAVSTSISDHKKETLLSSESILEKNTNSLAKHSKNNTTTSKESFIQKPGGQAYHENKTASENNISLPKVTQFEKERKTELNTNTNAISIAKMDDINKSTDSVSPSLTSPKKDEDVIIYIDDTIRRKVVIIDTVVQRDTVVINDTIKNKIRLFKKKR